jgi:methylthioribose-1-phosphate isomerase
MSRWPIPEVFRWGSDGRSIELLDQTRLPEEELYLRLTTAEEVAEAISSLRVRGAPAIGVVAAMGVAIGMRRIQERLGGGTQAEIQRGFEQLLDLLERTRPTGRNLTWALERVREAFRRETGPGIGAKVEALRREADRIAREEGEMCERIGSAGLPLIPEEGVGIMTHCNAGALATGGIGTALAPVYRAHARGTPLKVFACETRPVLQGARLTAWELTRAGIHVTVITDSMAASVMRDGKVGLVIVGADRVAANGDFANKVGTYSLAVLARDHGIPFYVAAPRSTFDGSLRSGAEIPIEERAEAEIRTGREGFVVPSAARVWNPAFDVTPEHLVTGLVTDRGLLRPPYTAAIRRLLSPDMVEVPE